MSWTEVFPVLDDEMVESYQSCATKAEREEHDGWFAVDRVVNRTKARHLVVSSLFWRNTRGADPDLPAIDRETLMKAQDLGLVTRFAPWDHYVRPLLEGAKTIRERRPDVGFRIYLASDMAFLVDDFTELGCEVCIMKGSSLRHNPGAMWRFLALEEKRRLVTITDADRAPVVEADIQRTEMLSKIGLGFWRVPVWGELNHTGQMNYRPILAGQFGSCKPIPAEILMKALIWHTLKGSISNKCMPPGCVEQTIYGTQWPDYGFDEWFLQAAVYPRIAFNGILSFVPAMAKSRLLPLDIEYCNWANSRAEITYFGSTRGGGCCEPGPADEDAELRKRTISAVQGISTLTAQLQKNGGTPHAGNPPETRTMLPRLVAICTALQDQQADLLESVKETVALTRRGELAVAVVVDCGSTNNAAARLMEEFSGDIANGHLVVAKVNGRRGFLPGMAKAMAHALGTHYADNLMNLDAGNYLSDSDLAALLRVMINHRTFVAHQYDGTPETLGRLLIPSWLYRAIGGYHCRMQASGDEATVLISAALAQSGSVYVPLPAPSVQKPPASAKPGAGTRPKGTGKSPKIPAVKSSSQNGHSPLPPTKLEVWDHRGRASLLLDHFSITPAGAATRRPGRSANAKRSSAR